MMRFFFNSIYAILCPSLLVFALSCNLIQPRNDINLYSPDGSISVRIFQDNGIFKYTIVRNGLTVIKPSRLGLEFHETIFFQDLEVVTTQSRKIDNHYQMLSGKRLDNHDFANEISLEMRNISGKTIWITFRAYNDGVAFNYSITEPGINLVLKEEKTEFHVNPEGFAWMQPFDWWAPAYEKEYENKIWIGQESPQHNEDGWAYPALFKLTKTWVMITEAGLDRSYCATHIRNEPDSSVYSVRLAQKEQGYAGGIIEPEINTPFSSPWRVIKLGSLDMIFQSNLVHHVSPESKIEDMEWIKPGRVSWSWLYEPDSPQDFNALKKYVDLSAEMNWEYSLVDANWNMMRNGNIYDLIEYANKKNVGLFLWYNSAGPHNTITEQPRDIINDPVLRRKEFAKLQELGIRGIKVDFFQSNKQNIIQLYIDIMEDAAAYELLVNFHGSTLPRGWQRTYPNMLTMESVKGGEFYLMDNPFTYTAARHNTILPFTRNVVGSMDYTPVNFSQNIVPHITTHGHELALSVVFESALFHFGDRAESYLSLPSQVKDFLRVVPAVWDESVLMDGYPGRYCIIARRNGSDWYIGGINGRSHGLEMNVDLSFLGEEKFTIQIIKDGADREIFEWETFAYPDIRHKTISALTEGGFVMRITPVGK